MPTYNQLVQNFKNKGAPGASGAAPYSPEWNDAYNAYYSNLAGQQGAPNFESINLGSELGTTSVGLPGVTAGLPNVPFNEAPTPSIDGGNYQQLQNSVQGGQFATVGTTEQQQTQSQQQTTSGTQTSRPDDVLGLGALLKDQAGTTVQSDAARNAWLTDVMQNGGTGFNSQLDAGIRQSLTGPGKTGIGDSARARTAGYAAANVGRENLNQRLAASNQLAGGTGLAALASAATPYGVGNTTNTSGTTTGLSELMSRATEAQSGATAAQSSQAGAGQIPESQPVKTGGCVLCTAAIELKLSKHHRVLRKVIKHKLVTDAKRFHPAAKGYFAVFTPFADWLIDHPRIARVLWPLAKAVVYEELRVAGRRLPLKPWAWTVHWVGHSVCAAIGRTLPVADCVTNPRILAIASRERILYPVEG